MWEIALRSTKLPQTAAFITEHGGVKLTPDHRLTIKADWRSAEERLSGARALLRQLADIASAGKQAA